jgi:hypothetical protein
MLWEYLACKNVKIQIKFIAFTNPDISKISQNVTFVKVASLKISQSLQSFIGK